MPLATTPPTPITDQDLHRVLACIEGAVVTLRRMPSPRPRQHGSTWPDVIHEFSDIWHATLTHEAASPRLAPTPQQISNLDVVIDWLAWLRAETDRETVRMVWAVASGFSYRRLGRKLGVSHHTVKRRFVEALYLVAMRFEKK